MRSELLAEERPTILAGDYNVIPTDDPDDVFSARAMASDALMQPESRQALRRILNLGYTDAIRARYPDGRGLHLLGLYRRLLAARRGLPHRSSAAQRPGRRPPARCRRRQGVSRAGKGQRPCADLGRDRGLKRTIVPRKWGQSASGCPHSSARGGTCIPHSAFGRPGGRTRATAARFTVSRAPGRSIAEVWRVENEKGARSGAVTARFGNPGPERPCGPSGDAEVVEFRPADTAGAAGGALVRAVRADHLHGVAVDRDDGERRRRRPRRAGSAFRRPGSIGPAGRRRSHSRRRR